MVTRRRGPGGAGGKGSGSGAKGGGKSGGPGGAQGGTKGDLRSAGGPRRLSERVKTAKKRTLSSTLWLQRQINDPFVAEAKARGLRSRAAFKLLQLDEKLGLLKPGQRVVDLGAAPGGWTQVAVERLGGKGRIVALDILPMDPVAGAEVLTIDFLEESAPERLKQALGGPADLVLSDMASPTTGHPQTDHLRIIALAEAALAYAVEVLAPGGGFVCKVFQGGSEKTLLATLKSNFAKVRHVKPPASRSDSSETYVVATGFRGGR